MHGKVIEEPLVGIRGALPDLVEQPGQVIPSPIGPAIGIMRLVVIMLRARPLLIVAAPKVSGPSPFFRPKHQRRWIDRFHLSGIIKKLVSNLGHCRADGMNVAMTRMPNRVLVIHEVIPDAAVGRDAPAVGQMLQPGLRKR